METGNYTTREGKAKQLVVTDCKPKRIQTCTDPDCFACKRREIDEAATGPGRTEGS